MYAGIDLQLAIALDGWVKESGCFAIIFKDMPRKMSRTVFMLSRSADEKTESDGFDREQLPYLF